MVTFKKKQQQTDDAALVRELPEPDDIALSLTQSLMRRRTAYDFSDETISDEHLSTILWAADGRNGKSRKDDHRTTPTTLNWKEIEIYVVKANGVWRWDPTQSVLRFIHDHDRRKDMCLLQPLVRQAPVHLVYVFNQEKTQNFVTDLARSIAKYTKSEKIAALTDEMTERAPLLDTGAKVMSKAPPVAWLYSMAFSIRARTSSSAAPASPLLMRETALSSRVRESSASSR